MKKSNVVWKKFSNREKMGRLKIAGQLAKLDQSHPNYIDIDRERKIFHDLISDNNDPIFTFKISWNSKMQMTGRNLKKIGIVRFIRSVGSINLPSGVTCDAANECYAYAKKDKNSLNKTGTVLVRNSVYSDENGKDYGGWCYAAEEENQYSDARKARYYNLTNLLRIPNVADIAYSLYQSIKINRLEVVRISSAGDFKNIEYYLAWLLVAEVLPEVSFFGYTKILPYIVEFRSMWSENIRIQYSFGGIYDNDLTYDENGFPTIPTAFVGLTPDDYPLYDRVCIDHEDTRDYEYIMAGRTFVLPIH